MLRFAPALLIAAIATAQPAQRLSPQQDYDQLIDPLLQVKDFGIAYVDDGAADASILRPRDGRPISSQVLSLIGIKSKAIPVLIDCLSDQRVSSAVFEGNNVTRKIRVPIGFLCLDLLLELTTGADIHLRDCADDGLGACVKPDFYFRPDDYSNCWSKHCLPRPWLFQVQSNWRKAYRARRLKFVAPAQLP